MRDFRKLDFWNDGIEFSVSINKITKFFPKEERFALADQLRRAASSIPSNIAEGSGRASNLEFARFIDIALGSAFESETQLIIAQRSGYLTQEITDSLLADLRSIERRLNAFKRVLCQQKTMINNDL
ncbi:MAG: four helix bundle protein [Prevotella sp.]|nr:four helix bundle protein [Prevotella sp.]MCF0208653.1 four helix bundle protein [Bacteroidaceae bacterium]